MTTQYHDIGTIIDGGMTMANRTKLNDEEIGTRLRNINGWTVTGRSLHKEFTFSTFVDAFSFMTKGALAAEAMNHHPDWSNVYNRVTVNLSTHDAGGISDLDFTLAAKLDAFVK
jgi:4a-hydroxytetrahydrobiopterin dehydratase